MRLKDRVTELEEEVRWLKLADERRRYEVHVMLRKKLPEDSLEWYATGPGGETWRLGDKLERESPKKTCDTKELGAWYQKKQTALEASTLGQEAMKMLMKRPPKS